MNRVLITGAISGIGLAAAQLFLERGWYVFIADKKEDSDVLDVIKDYYGDKVFYLKCDVSKDKDVKHLHSKICDSLKGVDCVINNAGIIKHGLLHETSEKDWDELMANDVKSIYLTAKYFIPDFIENGGGTIVNTASISGISADYGMPVYNAAKGAVVNLTRAMALDYAKFGIRVNSVCPAAVDTNMLNPDNIPGYAAVNPLKRICEPVEVAKAIYFLATDESSYCNGVNLPVTGGLDVHSGQPK
ncbi:MAG: SDR family oxidoreductase [Candidatus Gastranaerophilales bacterium]|nr:SDR family oxidoreductase [Candidatus Gastranaerophilales bacterium]MCM1073306.1 SDR family oxidoreductase [Bacteroides sp.]